MNRQAHQLFNRLRLLALLTITTVFHFACTTSLGQAAPPRTTSTTAIRVADAERNIATAYFEVVDGATKQQVLKAPAGESKQSAGIEMQCRVKPAATSAQVLWSTQIRNAGSGQRRLTLRWSVECRMNPGYDYWRGRDEPVSGEWLAFIPPGGANNTLPLQTLYGATSGYALAMDPMEIFSGLKQWQESVAAASPNAGSPNTRMTLEIPLVLDAGQQDSFEFALYSYTPRYGYLDAVQIYHDLYPKSFTPRTDIDPRSTGNGAMYLVWTENDFEAARRFGGDWEWVYAPFRRTGDIYGRAQFYDYTPARPFYDALYKLPFAEFHKERKVKLARGLESNTAMMFYVPSYIWAEERLALEKYPGAIVRNPDGGFAGHFTTPWVTGHDNEVLMYPWGNSYAEQTKEDLRQLVRDDLNIQGFAYDVLAGNSRHRADGVAQSPRRGFDETGVYADTAVAIAKMMDFTRDLERDGHKLAIVANPTGGTCRSFLAARTDNNMTEFAPYQWQDQLLSLRLMMGHKPLCWWDVWNLSDLMQWQKMTPAEIREAYLGARDYVLLASFRYGGVPAPWLTRGTPRLLRWLPTIRRVVRAGWQAVPAVRNLPDSVWAGRYGRGIGSFITLGNAGGNSFKGTIQIENSYLGAGNYIFASPDGSKLVQRIVGSITEVDVEIAPKSPLVLQAIAESPQKARGAATVTWRFDGAAGELTIDTKVPVRNVIAPAEECAPPRPLRKNVWSITSANFASPVSAIQSFPFFGGKETATIVLPAQPNADEEWAARRLQEYFRFWGKQATPGAKPIDLTVVRGTIGGAAASAAPRVHIGRAAPVLQQRERVMRQREVYLSPNDSRQLVVTGQTPRDVREAMWRLMQQLDLKYVYPGGFASHGRTPNEAAALTKAGISGKILDESWIPPEVVADAKAARPDQP